MTLKSYFRIYKVSQCYFTNQALLIKLTFHQVHNKGYFQEKNIFKKINNFVVSRVEVTEAHLPQVLGANDGNHPLPLSNVSLIQAECLEVTSVTALYKILFISVPKNLSYLNNYL